MRIGTWNLDNRMMSDQHRNLFIKEACDIWLLTEVNPKALNSFKGYHVHFTTHLMARKQHWAAVLSLEKLAGLPDPHSASALAIVGGIAYCSSILPWAGCQRYPPTPWVGGTLGEMTKTTIEALLGALPNSGLVWGGDWNQNLAGGWENVGSKDGRNCIYLALKNLNLQAPTSDLLHQLGTGHHSIDHIAVPVGWRIKSARGIPANGLSDHDAYIVDAQIK